MTEPNDKAAPKPSAAGKPSGNDASVDGAPSQQDVAAAALHDIQTAIRQSLKIAGRDDDAAMIAITKTKSADQIMPFLAAGHRIFGENRVQEAQEKWPELIAAYPDIELHMVGQLQSNKADDAVALFDVIHSLDRPSLAKALAKAMAKADKKLPCYIQVNIGDEPQKGGCDLAALPDLLALAQNLDLPIIGLMCVPPADKEPAPYFALLKQIAAKNGLVGLSMGMSSDFETAVRIGATCVRIGSTLFGKREPPRATKGWQPR